MLILTFLLSWQLNLKPELEPEMVLNQVIDLIVESGYMQDLQITEAHFKTNQVMVTMRSADISNLQEFTRGFHEEDQISYQVFKKGKFNFISLIYPWERIAGEGDIESLKSLAGKTVFSNKISLNFTDNDFELIGRPSDIISYLLQMAGSKLIQKYQLSVRQLESGRFSLKVLNI